MNLNIEIIKGWIKDKVSFCDPCMKKVIIVAIVCSVISAIVF